MLNQEQCSGMNCKAFRIRLFKSLVLSYVTNEQNKLANKLGNRSRVFFIEHLTEHVIYNQIRKRFCLRNI